MSLEVLQEELDVLESIYPTELTKLSEWEIQIDVEPEDTLEGGEDIKLLLNVVYPDTYPDSLPELSLEALEGEIGQDEIESLIGELNAVGQENLGMAMTFTLVSHLRERLLSLVKERDEMRKREEHEKERLALEEEEARTRGTPVTVESFRLWKTKFDKEIARKKAQDEEERLKGLSGKEREEYRKIASRLSGRQLFERDRNLATSDSTLVEDGTESVDVSQYERTEIEAEEEEERLQFSDSD